MKNGTRAQCTGLGGFTEIRGLVRATFGAEAEKEVAWKEDDEFCL